MVHPKHMGGSDAIWSVAGRIPRAWGTFPRYLGHYVRDLGLLGLEECVNHLTGRAAQRLRLADRGLVRDGYAADLVLFDPAVVTDTATFDEPEAAGARNQPRLRQRRMRDRGRRAHRRLAGRALRMDSSRMQTL